MKARSRAMVAASAVTLILAACVGETTQPRGSDGAGASSGPTTTSVGGTILTGVYDGEIERYVAIAPDDGAQYQVFEAEGCAPCVGLSPDGSTVMHPAMTDDGMLVGAFVGADGSDPWILEPRGTFSLGIGVWSPHGDRLAVNGGDQERPWRSGIYVVDAADGSVISRVTWARDENQEPVAWSPAGDRLLYWVETGSVGSVTHAGDLYSVAIDGSDVRRLNPDGVLVGRVTVVGAPASFSPDGTQVAFGGFDANAADDRSAVFVADLDGGTARRATGWGRLIAGANWSPSGEWIAFSPLDESVVSLVRPGGEELVTITPPDDGACCPAWSSDGAYLLIQRGGRGSSDLWIVDVAGEIVGQVTDDPGDYFGSTWAA